MIDSAIGAINIIKENNDDNKIGAFANRLKELSQKIDGKTGLFAPAIFNQPSLEFAKKCLKFLKETDTNNILESGWTNTLAKTFSFSKTKEQYTKYLDNQIKFFEFVCDSMNKSEASKKVVSDIIQEMDFLINLIDSNNNLEEIKKEYENIVNSILENSPEFPISCISCEAFKISNKPISMAQLFGKEETGVAFSEGRGQHKIFEQLLSCELSINKKLAAHGLINQNTVFSTVYSFLKKNRKNEDIENRVSKLIQNLSEKITDYKQGTHLYKNKTGAALFGGYVQNKFIGPNKNKSVLLNSLLQKLYSEKKDDNELQFSYVMKLLNHAIFSSKKHGELVGNSNLSLGETSNILDDLDIELCNILMSINLGNEPYIRDNLLKFHEEDREKIQFSPKHELKM